MTSQQHDMYIDYASSANRSPNSSRPAYGAGGAAPFQSGLSLPRQSQRPPFEAPLGSSALYPADRLPGGYNARGGLDQMAPPSGLGPAGYMLDGAQGAWNYNAANVQTVNGAMNGASRQRSVNRRTALPTTWTANDPAGLGMHAPLQNFTPAGLGNHPMGSGGMRGLDQGLGNGSGPDFRFNAGQTGDDQLIPTAIVIKNIPFAVRKESLANLMLDLQLPVPYAFNYHFDGGIFRGLAFANFQSPEDTRIVIETMNGLEVHGRKLRVEYKKMLPAEERERIEREKRERRGQLEEQHRGPMLTHQSSVQSLNMAASQAPPNIANMANMANMSPMRDVDMNDPQTLTFFTELLLFKRDPSREIMIFPPTVSPEHRRQIHILAHNMGLEHQSVGENGERQIHVLKPQASVSPTVPQTHTMPSVSLDMHKRGLSRAATFDFADRESRNPSTSYAHALNRHGPTLEIPGSPDGSILPNNLRSAKSFADLRTLTPSPSASSSSYHLAAPNGLGGTLPTSNLPGPTSSAARFGDYGGFSQQTASASTPNLGTPNTPGQSGGSNPGASDAQLGLASGIAGLSLGSYEPAVPQSQMRSTPGAIGSQRPSASRTTSQAAPQQPERQPRAADWDNPTGGFATRNSGRTNGHVQRGSDSSGEAGRVGTSSSSSRFH